jgi:hypothetical protein
MSKLQFNCPNCGEFSSNKWTPLAGDNCSVNCPVCWKYIISKRIKNGPARPNGGTKRTRGASNPLYITTKPSEPAGKKKRVSLFQKKTFNHNQTKLQGWGICESWAEIVDLWLSGSSIDAISGSMGGLKTKYVRKVIGTTKNKLLPTYSNFKYNSITTLLGFRKLGLIVNINRFNEMKAEAQQKRFDGRKIKPKDNEVYGHNATIKDEELMEKKRKEEEE